jgi:haloacetate dehalogenase
MTLHDLAVDLRPRPNQSSNTTHEDYRAAATRDFEDDARDLALRVRCPLLAVWGEFGKMHDLFDVLATWKEKADVVSGHPLPCGHFIPEEAPEALLADLQAFLRA